jgi:hypothetical protein
MTYLRLCSAALMLAAGGCGLISSDVTNFQLKTESKTFTVDTQKWNVNATAANVYLGQSCAAAPTECGQWVMTACTMNCSGSCDMTTQKCDLGLNVSVYQGVDINMSNPELAMIAKEPVVKVSIDSLTYTVSANTLNVATPEMTVYVAPMSVMSPTDPSAVAIGTIPPVPAMTTTSATMMMFTDGGKQALVDIMGNYKTPFNVIVGSTVVVKMGDPLPSGMLMATVEIAAHAGV